MRFVTGFARLASAAPLALVARRGVARSRAALLLGARPCVVAWTRTSALPGALGADAPLRAAPVCSRAGVRRRGALARALGRRWRSAGGVSRAPESPPLRERLRCLPCPSHCPARQRWAKRIAAPALGSVAREWACPSPRPSRRQARPAARGLAGPEKSFSWAFQASASARSLVLLDWFWQDDRNQRKLASQEDTEVQLSADALPRWRKSPPSAPGNARMTVKLERVGAKLKAARVAREGVLAAAVVWSGVPRLGALGGALHLASPTELACVCWRAPQARIPPD